MSHPQDTEVDYAAAELQKQLQQSLLIARRVMLSRHTRRLARPVAGAAKSAVRATAVRWPVAAAAAGWAAAHAAREAAAARWQQAAPPGRAPRAGCRTPPGSRWRTCAG